jgi:V8-like Glu-specific endopeptidase
MLVPHLDELGLGSLRRARAAAEEGAEPGEPDDMYAEVLETICGATDDSQPVEQYDGTLGVPVSFVAAHQGPVAQVQWNSNLGAIYTNPGNVSGVRWGSGTMVSPDIFLTCGHLFDQTGGGWNRPLQNGTTNIISPQEIATNMHLNFNYQVDPSGAPRAEQSFAITQLIEYRLGGVDMAVCRIAGSPGNIFGFTAVSTVDAAVNDMLCIIGHPAGLRKRIEAGPALSLSGNQIRYNDIDTLGGNSGSGILHGPTGQLVGVHTNGGCNAAGTGSNFGMRITSIRANSPTLRGLGGRTNRIDDKTLLSDIATSVLRDKPILSDIRTTAWRDIATSVLRDKSILSDIGGRKRLDDVKAAGLDKGGFDQPGGFDPGFGRRPFVLATPHHATVGETVAGAGRAEEYEVVLAQLEAAIAEQQQQLEELAAQYEALRDEYETGLAGE